MANKRKGVNMEQPNTLYPGRPNYEGPTEGIFGLVHHDVLFEASEDIMERVDFIREHKPKDEVKTRLHCLVYLPPERLPINLVEAGKAYVEAEKAYDGARKAYIGARKAYIEARKARYEAVEDLIKELVPDCPWDGKKLDFTKADPK